MATYSRVKTFVANETLTASDLNTEFNNIITNTNSGNLNSDNVSTSAAWTWTGYHTYSTSSRIVLADNIFMTLGNATDGDYRLRYNSSNTALELTSTNSDGSGTDAVVMDVQDGTDDVRIRGGLSTNNNAAPTSGIVTGGNIVSDTDSTDDLGTTSVRWANLYVDAATITNNLTVGGTLTLTGGLTLNGNVTVGDSASDTLTINSTITSNLIFTDNTYDIGASGATRPRDLFLSRNALMGGTLGVTGLITASGGVSGALTGNVTGNVTGNLTGNVTGNVTGDVTGNISGNVTGGTISGTTGTFSGLIAGNGGAEIGSNTAKVKFYSDSIYSGIYNGSSLVSDESYYFGSGDHFWYSDGTLAMKIDNGDFAVDTDTLFVDASADRVAVNNASPQAPMHIIGSAGDPSATHSVGNAQLILENNSQTFLEFATGTTHYSGITFSDDVATRGAVAYDHGTALGGGADSLHFQTAGSLKAVINASGDMGIGTVSPTNILTLQKNQSADTALEIYNTNSGASAKASLKVGFDSSNHLHIHRVGNAAGIIYNATQSGSSHQFQVAGTQLMTLNSSGHLGLGAVPNSNWTTGNATIQVGAQGGIWAPVTTATNTAFSFSHNGYYNGSAWKYIHTGAYAAQYYQYQGGHYFRTAASGTADADISYSDVLTILNDGKTGIGTASPRYNLAVKGNNTTAVGIALDNDSGGGTLDISALGASYGAHGAGAGEIWFYSPDNINIGGATGNTNDIKFLGAGAEIARFTSDGNLLVGTTSVVGRITAQAAAGNNVAVLRSAGADTNTRFIRFDINGSTEVGSITYTGSATAYNTSSDYRIKENVVGITDGITRIKSLKPSRFNFISNADQTVDGFVAHEVSDIVPEAITGEKDAVDKNGDPEYQGIDQSKLVPLLTAALQEAITKIETLETKVSALEAA